MPSTARDYLQALYLDWVNNWVSVEKFSEYHGLTKAQGFSLIDIAREVHNTPHPES